MKNQVQFYQGRSFGRVFAVVFLLIAIWPLFNGGSVLFEFLLISIAMILLAQFAPLTLKIPSRLWLSFGLALHRITNPLILGVLYFGIFTPLGLSMRGMRRKFRGQSGQETYWVDRRPLEPTPESMQKQF